MRFILAMVFSLAALHLDAAMVRVVRIDDGRTITIDRNGTHEQVRLAGVTITDDARARELLRWTTLGTWVMLEPSGNGEFLVYRSPDALFLNRELVLRGFARATQHGIEPELRAPSRYLGELDPPPVVSAPGTRTGSGTSRRSSAQRSRPPRAPAKRSRR